MSYGISRLSDDFQLACKNFIVLLFGSVRRCVSACPETSENMDNRAFFDPVQILHSFAFPCDDVVPCPLIYGGSIPCLVEVICDHCEVDYLASVVLVCAYCSDASLELDFVDVFNLFHKKCVKSPTAKEVIKNRKKAVTDSCDADFFFFLFFFPFLVFPGKRGCRTQDLFYGSKKIFCVSWA